MTTKKLETTAHSHLWAIAGRVRIPDEAPCRNPPDCNDQAVLSLFTRACGSQCVRSSAKAVQPCGRFCAG
nr:MAG TPA: hypothetical protein [Caudoviricetes sp.]